MKLSWKGFGRKINGFYMVEWQYNGDLGQQTWYRIISLLTYKVILEITLP